MIDKLHFKAHLRDFYLNHLMYSDDYEAQGRGEYQFIRISHDIDCNPVVNHEAISYERYLQIKAVTPEFVRFVPQRFSLLELGMPLQAGVKPRRKSDGSYDHKNFDSEKLTKYWESIESSYSGLAFNLHDYRDKKHQMNLHCPVYIEFHASPAKLLQGHNVFGSDDPEACKNVLVDVLLAAYPLLAKFFDFDDLWVNSFDVTYFSRAESETQARAFIDAIIDVSRGQTKARTGFAGATAYFGSARSKLKKLKVYGKNQEVMAFVKDLQNSLKKLDVSDNAIIPFDKIKDYNLLKIYNQDLLDFTLGMIRWEATIKSDWLRERGYSLQFNQFKNEFDAHEIWKTSFKDLFFLLESKSMTITDYSEDNIRQQLRDTFVTYDRHGKARYTAADNAYRTFMLIKECGYQKALQMHIVSSVRQATKIKQTWYAHLQMFRDIGLTDIYLQGFKDGEDSTSKVVPLLIFSKVDFSAQFPHFYKAA